MGSVHSVQYTAQTPKSRMEKRNVNPSDVRTSEREVSADSQILFNTTPKLKASATRCRVTKKHDAFVGWRRIKSVVFSVLELVSSKTSPTGDKKHTSNHTAASNPSGWLAARPICRRPDLQRMAREFVVLCPTESRTVKQLLARLSIWEKVLVVLRTNCVLKCLLFFWEFRNRGGIFISSGSV